MGPGPCTKLCLSIIAAWMLMGRVSSDDVDLALALTLQEVQDAYQATSPSTTPSQAYPTMPADGPRYSPALRHQRNRPVHPDSVLMDTMQLWDEQALLLLMKRNNASKTEVQHAVAKMDLSELEAVSMRKALCGRLYPTECDPSDPYRSLDGSCNNIEHPSWGKALSCHARITPPVYPDGVSSPRTLSLSGRPLPNPRQVSNALWDLRAAPGATYSQRHTHLVMAFGQLVDHDLALTPDARGVNGSLLQCCGDGGERSPSCFPVSVAGDDSFYGPLSVSCMNFVRSSGCSDCGGVMHERRFVNQQSAYLDASHVYGTNQLEHDTLRDPEGMELMLLSEGRLLPRSLRPDRDGCSDPETARFCFRAGDGRVNQQPAIAVLQIAYARQHNRIARELKKLNPGWDAETVYQEARRVLVAQHQHIIYTEYLPVVLGRRFPPIPGLRSRYDARRDPSVLVEFATAAFRFGHGMADHYSLVDEHFRGTVYSLADHYFLVDELHDKGTVDRLIRGLALQRARVPSPALSDAVREHLYRNASSQAGLDLASLNVQRGRDHAIPGYAFWLRRCLGRRVHDFADLYAFMEPRRAQLLAELYERPDDVDLWVGGLMERPANPDALVGPTFACIIARQFRGLQEGDRFFYSHGGPMALTDAQLLQVSQFSLAKLLCANADEPHRMVVQRDALLRPDAISNPLTPCDHLPDTDLRYWTRASAMGWDR
ncbi:salivary peroxidase/catechol oxidase-like [Dermacentor albipictus]|uniref:salivary peroxidase/catechol oxidase-like n=1 Tax=Dermacentor albipictus TaxID=60249 RepID=UPI0031FDCA72